MLRHPAKAFTLAHLENGSFPRKSKQPHDNSKSNGCGKK
jgi:hypothetical protein